MNTYNFRICSLAAMCLLLGVRPASLRAQHSETSLSSLSQTSGSLEASLKQGVKGGAGRLLNPMRRSKRTGQGVASSPQKPAPAATQETSPSVARPRIAWSHDLKKAACVEADNNLYVLTNGDNAAKKKIPVKDAKNITALALNEDGTLLAAGYKGHQVELWNLSSAMPAAQILNVQSKENAGFNKDANVTALAFGVVEGQKKLASCADDAFVALYALPNDPRQPPVWGRTPSVLTSIALCENMLAGATQGADAHVMNLYNITHDFGTLIGAIPSMAELVNVGSKIVAWEMPQNAADADPFALIPNKTLGYAGKDLLDLAHKYLDKAKKTVTDVVGATDPSTPAKPRKDATTAKIVPVEVGKGKHQNSIECLAFAPNGQFLACASKDTTVTVYQNMEDQWNLVDTGGNKHASGAGAVAFNPGDKILLADGGRDNNVRSFDFSANKAYWFNHHGDWVFSLAYYPQNPKDGSSLWLLSGSADCTAKLWNTADSGLPGITLPTSFDGKQDPNAKAFVTVAWSPQGKFAAGANLDGHVYIWQRPDDFGKPKSSNKLKLIFKLPARANGQDQVTTVAFVEEDKLVSGGIKPKNKNVKADKPGADGHSVLWWSLKQPDKPVALATELSDVYSLAYTKNDNLLAAGSVNGVITLWNVNKVAKAGKSVPPLVQIDAHPKYKVRSLAFSPDGKCLASGGGEGDNRILLWTVNDLKAFSNDQAAK